MGRRDPQGTLELEKVKGYTKQKASRMKFNLLWVGRELEVYYVLTCRTFISYMP
jgi:hypothetical protein